MPTIQSSPASPQAPAAPASPMVSAPGQGADLATLQGQVRELQIQLSGLEAQWDGLHSQLDAMLKNNPARPGVQQKWADVGVEIAQVKGQIAYREARISQME